MHLHYCINPNWSFLSPFFLHHYSNYLIEYTSLKLVVQLLHLTVGVDAVIAVLAVTSLAVNLIQATMTRDQKMTRAFPVFGLLLSLLPVWLSSPT